MVTPNDKSRAVLFRSVKGSRFARKKGRNINFQSSQFTANMSLTQKFLDQKTAEAFESKVQGAAERATAFFRSLAPGDAPRGYATAAYKGRDDLAYALSRVPMLTPRPLKVICMGAGFGGIGLARSVRVGNIPGVKLTIYEKNAGIGGTWYENRYPGYIHPFFPRGSV